MPVREKRSSGRGYADILSDRTKAAGKRDKGETPEHAGSVGSVRSSQSRRYYGEMSPYKSLEKGAKSGKAVGSVTSTPSNLNSSSALSQNDSPRFSNTFKEARKAVCDLYTIWRSEFEDKQQQAAPSSSNTKSKGRQSGKFERKSNDGKLELPSNAVEYLQETVNQLQDEAKFLQRSMEAYHKGMISLMDRNKGIDMEAINKKNLREKGVPLESLNISRTEKLDLQANAEAMERAEKKLAESQQKYSDALAEICEIQDKLAERDSVLRALEVELEQKVMSEKRLSSKCESLHSQLEEEATRSRKALKEFQKSSQKDDQIDTLVKSIQERLDSKTQQCNDLQDELLRSQTSRAHTEEQIDKLKKEMKTKEVEASKKLELTLSDVERLSKEYSQLSESVDAGKEESSKKLSDALRTIETQEGECSELKKALADAQGKLTEAEVASGAGKEEISRLKEHQTKLESMRKGMQKDLEAKIKEIQGLNQNLSTTLSEIDGAKHLAGVLSNDINKGLQNYIEDVLECKTPRSISGSPNPFSNAAAEQKSDAPKSLDVILGSNGGPRPAAPEPEEVQGAPEGGKGGSQEDYKPLLASILSDLGISGDKLAEQASSSDLMELVKTEIVDLVAKKDQLKLNIQQREVEIMESEKNNKDLQVKLMRAQTELEDVKVQPEISIGSAVASPSRSRSHTVDNAVFKEHSSLSEVPQFMINEDEDIEFSSSDEEEGGNLESAQSSPRKSIKRDSKSLFSRQNSKQITDGIAEDLRNENDSLRIKLTQMELENEALNRRLKEKEREIGKQTSREMETIRRASAVYDTQAMPGQKGFWKGKRGRGNSKGNGEEMQHLVAELTGRYSDLSLKFAEKCTEADELKHQMKQKDVEIKALKELYAIPDILEQNNNIWVSFRIFIPGDDEKGVPTVLLVGTDGIYIPHWQEQQFYDYTTIAKFEVRDNEFVFWALTTESRKLNEVNLYCNAVLPSAILSSIQSAIKVKLDVHNTATSSIRVAE